MTFRLWLRGHTRAQIDAELARFTEIIRARMYACWPPQRVEIIVSSFDVLNPGGGQQAVWALRKLVYRRFDREGYEPSIVEHDAADDSGPPRATLCSYARTSTA